MCLFEIYIIKYCISLVGIMSTMHYTFYSSFQDEQHKEKQRRPLYQLYSEIPSFK